MTRRTTCRICESACGLIAEVDVGRVTHLAPDRVHPISRGYACVKGTRFVERVQYHPDRLTSPTWQGSRVAWREVMARIRERLRPILREHGPEAIGIYSGNAAGHQLGAVLGVTALQRALGTTKHYSCLTLDNSEQFVVAEAVFGNPLTTFVADYQQADCVVLFGTDPLQSQASQSQSHPRAGLGLRARAQAGQLWVVDPRRSVTARAGHHLALRPGTDVFVLAWLVRALGDRVEPAIARAVEPFDDARVAEVSGLNRAALTRLLEALTHAGRPLVWSGLGVLLGPHGTLGWWLTVVLQRVLGGLGSTWRYQPSAVNLPGWFSRLGVRGRDPSVRSPVGDWPAILGTLPAATLPADVLGHHEHRLRALIVIGGDPASALPDTTRAHRALEALDLLVSVDLFVNETGRRAHAVLPAATWLERDQLEVHTAHQRPRSHLRLDRAVVPPVGDCRTDWSILIELCRTAGRPPFGSVVAGAAVRAGLGPVTVARAVTSLSGVPWRQVTSERGHLGDSIGTMPTPRLAVPEWCEALRALPDPPGGLRLVTSVRPTAAMNHWLRPPGEVPMAEVHPSVCPEGPAVLRGAAGELEVRVAHAPDVHPGAVVLGFGVVGTNPNRVIGTDVLEPFSGQPVSNGTPVTLVPTGAGTS